MRRVKRKDRRFEKVSSESIGGLGSASVIRDKRTGVEYLFVSEGYAGGLTPLLDIDGKPTFDALESTEQV